MTFFSSRVIGRVAVAVCGVVAAVAIGFPSIVASPVEPGSWPGLGVWPAGPRHHGRGGGQESLATGKLAPAAFATIANSYLRLPSKTSGREARKPRQCKALRAFRP